MMDYYQSQTFNSSVDQIFDIDHYLYIYHGEEGVQLHFYEAINLEHNRDEVHYQDSHQGLNSGFFQT